MKRELIMRKMQYILYLSIIFSIVISPGCNENSNNSISIDKTYETSNNFIPLDTPKMESTETLSNDSSSENRDWKATQCEIVNNFDGVTLTAKKDTVSRNELAVLFKNNSKCKCIYGEYFSLEKKIKDRWYSVPYRDDDNYGFNSIGFELNPGDEKEWSVNWEWLYGSLDIGEYRIIKDISDFRASGDYDKYLLAAEFDIQPQIRNTSFTEEKAIKKLLEIYPDFPQNPSETIVKSLIIDERKGTTLKVKYNTKAEKIGEEIFLITLTKDWGTMVNGKEAISWNTYRVYSIGIDPAGSRDEDYLSEIKTR